VKLTILSAAPGPSYDDIGWIAAVATAMCMAGLAAIQLATPPTLFDLEVALRLAVAALAGVLAVASSFLSPVLVLWLLAATLSAQVVIELGGHDLHAGAAAPPV
jgi:hypothetical protein